MRKQYKTALAFIALISMLTITWSITDQQAFAQNTSAYSSTSYRREVIKTFSQTQFQREMETIASQGWELILVNEGASYSHEIITYWRRMR